MDRSTVAINALQSINSRAAKLITDKNIVKSNITNNIYRFDTTRSNKIEHTTVSLNALQNINPKAAKIINDKNIVKSNITNNDNYIFDTSRLNALRNILNENKNKDDNKTHNIILQQNILNKNKNINNGHNLLQENLVSIRLRNGLGNRIFQILAAQGYAEKYNKQLIICKALNIEGHKPHEQNTDRKLLRIFPDLNYVNTFSNYITIDEKIYFKYNILEKYNSNVLLNGFFQSPEYFPSKIPSIKTSYYDNIYFIHIRAGDYLQYNYVWGIDIITYFKNCFNQINPSIKYIVFSNDNIYAQIIMSNFNVSYTMSETIDQVDTLIEMANCAGGICVNSSFGWLGALFQGETRGKIFMPSIWNKLYDCKGIYPKWATIIDTEIINTKPYIPVQQNIIQSIKNISTYTNKVTVVLSGGLGNQLFQIFAGMAYAINYNKEYVVCKAINQSPVKAHEINIDRHLMKIFPDLHYVDSFNSYKELREKRHMEYDKLPYIEGNVLIRGYFQVENYSLLLPEIPNIRTDYYENTYFIHIRLTDYIGFFGMDYDKTKYHRNCFNILGSNAKYIVFSDDAIKAKEYIRKFNINYRMSDKTDALDALIEMANCAGGICANSTFSWMGAFFQRQPRGKIFVPNRWVIKNVNGIFPSWAVRVDS
jgi:hypothetical protein